MTPAGVVIRPLTRADRPAVAFAHRRLGARSRYQRFLGGAEVDRMPALDHWHHDALIAFAPVPRAPIGVARYVRMDRFDHAEVALEVVDAWQRRGIGTALLAALGERAARSGIRVLCATALWENRGARMLARHVGPVQLLGAEAGVIEFAVTLPRRAAAPAAWRRGDSRPSARSGRS